jgi:hypothetical protein
MIQICSNEFYGDIDYDTFIGRKKIVDIDTTKYSSDGYTADVITYDKTIKIPLSLDLLHKNNEGKYYYKYEWQHDANIDIIDNINCECQNKNLEISHVIGGATYNDLNEYISLAVVYHNYNIVITFLDAPANGDELNINFKCYMLGDADRKIIAYSTIYTNKYKYKYYGGMFGCNPIMYSW